MTRFCTSAPVLISTLVVFSSLAQAGTVLQVSPSATPDLAGFSSFTFSVVSDTAATFDGLDAIFQASTINQVNSPTIFDGQNDVGLTATQIDQDSRFLFNNGDVLAIGASESTSGLTAAFGLSVPVALTANVPQDIARIVMPDGIFGTTSMEATISGVDVVLATDQAFGVPEPSTGLMAIAAISVLAFHRRR